MTELKKLTTFIKDNITLILLLIYSVSFINYYLFYKSFAISVFNYITISDLIFFTLEYVFKILLIIIVYEIVYFFVFSVFFELYEKVVLLVKKKFLLYLKSNKKNKERILELFHDSYNQSLAGSKLLVVIIGIFFVGLLPNKLIFIPAYFVYFIYVLEVISEERMFDFSIPFASVIIILSMLFTTCYSSYTKRFTKDEFVISFIVDNKEVTTENKYSSLNYLGETSTNIFLYDIKTKKAKIYNKNNISDLEIQNTNTLDDFIIQAKNSYPIKILIEMFKEK